MGNGDGADDFAKNHKAFKEFLSFAQSEKARLILLGDIFEFWQFPPESIYKRYRDTIDTMFGMTWFYVIGNHDSEVPILGCPANLRTRLLFRKCLLLHGNEYDYWNRWGSMRGRKITKMWGYIEQIIPTSIDNIAEKLWRSSNDRYYNKIYADMEKTNTNFAIFGHTHKRSLCEYKDKIIINIGCWTENDLNYAVIKDNEVNLVNWRS
jgi:UDP-2,3-diacylglucosamine pyrophosphatase LpxH